MADGGFGELVVGEPYGDHYGNVVAKVGGGDVSKHMDTDGSVSQRRDNVVDDESNCTAARERRHQHDGAASLCGALRRAHGGIGGGTIEAGGESAARRSHERSMHVGGVVERTAASWCA